MTNPYIPMFPNKKDTATKRLVDFLSHSQKLGLEKISCGDLITHVILLGKLEEQLLKSAFTDGREFQQYEDNDQKDNWEDEIADKYYLENFTRYI